MQAKRNGNTCRISINNRCLTRLISLVWMKTGMHNSMALNRSHSRLNLVVDFRIDVSTVFVVAISNLMLFTIVTIPCEFIWFWTKNFWEKQQERKTSKQSSWSELHSSHGEMVVVCWFVYLCFSVSIEKYDVTADPPKTLANRSFYRWLNE